jgi:ribonuclease-3
MDPSIVNLPYNNMNKLLQVCDVHTILNRYGVNIGQSEINVNIYRNAMVHRSYCCRKNENFLNGNVQCPDDCLPLQEESYERLEFLGDAVINLIVGKYLYERYPDENEGFLTKLRTKLVNGTMLATLCGYVELRPFIIISKQIDDNNGRNNIKIMEDVFEAFIGAIILDGNYDMAELWLTNFIESHIDFSELITANTNHKDVFLKHFQHAYTYLPKFFEISTENTWHGKTYTVCIKDKNNAIISTGKGNTKKHAENDAALAALQYFGIAV